MGSNQNGQTMVDYVSPWAMKKDPEPQYTDLELAIMEGGHSLSEEQKTEKLLFIKSIIRKTNEH